VEGEATAVRRSLLQLFWVNAGPKARARYGIGSAPQGADAGDHPAAGRTAGSIARLPEARRPDHRNERIDDAAKLRRDTKSIRRSFNTDTRSTTDRHAMAALVLEHGMDSFMVSGGTATRPQRDHLSRS